MWCNSKKNKKNKIELNKLKSSRKVASVTVRGDISFQTSRGAGKLNMSVLCQLLGDIDANWHMLPFRDMPFCLSVCLSLCVSRSCIVLKRQKISIRFLLHTTALWRPFATRAVTRLMWFYNNTSAVCCAGCDYEPSDVAFCLITLTLLSSVFASNNYFDLTKRKTSDGQSSRILLSFVCRIGYNRLDSRRSSSMAWGVVAIRWHRLASCKVFSGV